ncbi:aminotransferase class I/II-fold pyridoxal phosphate-dependent enzyme [Rubrivirga sp. S365]|uniref:aminotransferase class I/II-fold pyridoxal phosphate-dependent enzyme n=1 Tax=Rubrivirga sp. S365 TaxID=3076080 RepID=UPI0028C57996|nr:aminotransferase class I/II-fold pyridoxal phosphate-dependent enzyme [Rubrivirga sp. S365]MDT7858231.1 aminotransferase class I/II-fold pyridoxal phosphate-dependent enzyme [Rubrivirga sp. S365]
MSATDTPAPEFPDDMDLRSILLRSRRLGVRDRTRAYSQWIQGVQGRGESLYHRVVSSAVDREVTVRDDRTGEDRPMLMFGSNNYLGLTNHPYVVERVRAAVSEWGAGVGGAPLLSGYSALHRELEERIAAFKGTEAAVLYNSGYGTNVGLLSGLVGRRDVAYCDERSHASTFDGLSMSQGDAVTFAHNDADDLGRHLDAHAEAYPDGDAFVCVAGVYSMDGDPAPLAELVPVAKARGAFTVVDDAHGLGVLGRQGRGAADAAGVADDCDVLMGTFSKVFGVTGGVACTSRAVADYLRHFSRANVFSASLSPATVAAVLAGLDLLERGEAPLGELHENVAYFVGRLRAQGFDVASGSAIVPVPVPEGMSVRRVTRFLHDEGVFANAVEYPAVAVHRQRLRFSVMASHTRADLDRATDVVAEAWARFAPDGAPSGAPSGVAAVSDPAA